MDKQPTLSPGFAKGLKMDAQKLLKSFEPKKDSTNGQASKGKLRKKKVKPDEAFLPVKPCNNPVSGFKVAVQLKNTLNKYLVLPDHADIAITLWILFSFVFDQFDVCPILAITSPEKRCGKTSLLALLTALCQKPLAGSNITPAATFRAIDKWHPTLLVDEADTFLNKKDELRGILNSGHTRATAYVTRTVPRGKGFTIKRFSTWAPKAIALIGKLSDTLEDRSIRIKMRRKKKSEKKERIQYSKLHGQLKDLRSQIARWAADANMDTEATPLEKLDDRAADNWQPLLTIAHEIEWSEEAIKAAVSFSGTPDSQTYRTVLLKDIHTIFGELKSDKVFTSALIKKLCSNPEKPWAEFSHGNPISPRKLASMLNPFDVSSKNLTIDGKRKKGYTKKSFKDAFDRYI